MTDDDGYWEGREDMYREQRAEIDRLTAENERLVAILRKCMPGRYVVDLGGESICLHQQDDLQEKSP